MGNGLVDNVFYIDSAAGNTALDLPAKCKVQCVAFWGADSNSVLKLSGSDTAKSIVMIGNPSALDATYSVYLGGVNISTIKAPIVTGGTAWLYLA